MHVLNVHERTIPRPVAEVGALIDTLTSDNDRLWPANLWPAMRFDRPLAVGATGGHGPIRYSVEELRPGRYVRFRFSGPRSLAGGHHRLEAVAVDGTATVLRHVLEVEAGVVRLIPWYVGLRWLHDACLEDALSTAESSLGLKPAVRPWSPWVRLLRWLLAGRRARPQVFPDAWRTSAD